MKKYYFVFLLVTASASAQLEWHALTSILTNGNNQRFDDVFFLNENLGWAANGSNAAIYKTIDGGENWTLQLAEQTPQLPGNHYFRNVEFLNENIGFVGTLNAGKFLKTVDGGATWDIVTGFATPLPAICGIDCVGTSTIYGCGAYFSPAYVIKSSDSGVTWEFIDMSAYAVALVEILFVDENTGYASGQSASGGTVLKTIDGGATWTEIYNSNIEGEYVWKLQILPSDEDMIFGSVESVEGNSGKLIRTSDGGTNWTSYNVPDIDIQAVGFITPMRGWMGGHSSPILETNDGGATWTDVGLGSNLNRIFFVNQNLAYASGSTIYKLTDENLGNSNYTENKRLPLKAAVSPNPVKDKLNLTVEFTESDHIRIELYDALGHRIKELQKDDINGAAKKNYTFDFPYASGTYIINLHTNTGRQSIKFIK